MVAHFPRTPQHILILLIGIWLLPAASWAECAPIHTQRAANPWSLGFRIIEESAGAQIDSAAVASGVAMWTQACGEAIPDFSPRGNINIRIRFHPGANTLNGCGQGCGCTIVNTLPGPDGREVVSSAIIHLFEHHRDGSGHCAAHRATSIAHDLGHALGLQDLPQPYGEHCAGRIMSYTGYRSVEAEDCRALGTIWHTAHHAPLSTPQLQGPGQALYPFHF